MNYVSLFFDFKKYIVMFPHDTFDPVINSVFIHKCFLRTYKVLGIVLSDRNISVSKKHPTLWFSYLMIFPKSSLSIVWVYVLSTAIFYFVLACWNQLCLSMFWAFLLFLFLLIKCLEASLDLPVSHIFYCLRGLCDVLDLG